MDCIRPEQSVPNLVLPPQRYGVFKNDFIEKVKEFNSLSIEERQGIADSCYSKMSKEKYFKK